MHTFQAVSVYMCRLVGTSAVDPDNGATWRWDAKGHHGQPHFMFTQEHKADFNKQATEQQTGQLRLTHHTYTKQHIVDYQYTDNYTTLCDSKVQSNTFWRAPQRASLRV